MHRFPVATGGPAANLQHDGVCATLCDNLSIAIVHRGAEPLDDRANRDKGALRLQKGTTVRKVG